MAENFIEGIGESYSVRVESQEFPVYNRDADINRFKPGEKVVFITRKEDGSADIVGRENTTSQSYSDTGSES